MNTLARISAGIAIPAAVLAVAACGSQRVAATQGRATTDVAAQASGKSSTAAQSATTHPTGNTQRSAPPHALARSHRHRLISAKQQKGLFSEGDHPKVAGTPALTRRTRSITTKRSPGVGARPVRLKRAPKQPDLGKYVGPPNNGAGSCGYVAVGPGMEQAEAFTVRSVGCDTARRVASASKGHTSGVRVSYRALGFSCTGSTPGNDSSLHYVCDAGEQSIRFIVS